MAIFGTYKSLDDITVKVFYDILKSRNYYLMYRYSFMHYIAKNVSKIKNKGYLNFQDIYSTYCDKIGDNKSANYFALVNEISHLHMRFNIVKQIVMRLNESNKHFLGKELHRWNFIFNPKEKVINQREQLIRQLKASINKLKRKNNELDSITEKNEQSTKTVYTEKINLEQIIGVTIDLEKTTMSEWLELQTIAKDIVKQKNKAVKNG
jgi:hypothetical protein